MTMRQKYVVAVEWTREFKKGKGYTLTGFFLKKTNKGFVAVAEEEFAAKHHIVDKDNQILPHFLLDFDDPAIEKWASKNKKNIGDFDYAPVEVGEQIDVDDFLEDIAWVEAW